MVRPSGPAPACDSRHLRRLAPPQPALRVLQRSWNLEVTDLCSAPCQAGHPLQAARLLEASMCTAPHIPRCAGTAFLSPSAAQWGTCRPTSRTWRAGCCQRPQPSLPRRGLAQVSASRVHILFRPHTLRPCSTRSWTLRMSRSHKLRSYSARPHRLPACSRRTRPRPAGLHASACTLHTAGRGLWAGQLAHAWPDSPKSLNPRSLLQAPLTPLPYTAGLAQVLDFNEVEPAAVVKLTDVRISCRTLIARTVQPCRTRMP